MEIINQSKVMTLDKTLYRRENKPSGDIHLGMNLYPNEEILGFTSNLDELAKEGLDDCKIICIEKGEEVEAIVMGDLYFLVLRNKHLAVIGIRSNFVTCIVQSEGV